MEISKLAKQIMDMDLTSIMRWFSILHNSFAPGYVILFVFYTSAFTELTTAKLVLLAICISIPIFYFLFTLFAHYLIWRHKPSDHEQTIELRVATLLYTSIAIILLDSAVLVWQKVN